MAFLKLIAQLRQARSELADHNIRVATADENGDWDTKDNLREADYEYAAAVIEELDKIVDLLDTAITWPAWKSYLAGALNHAELMPDDAAPVRLAQIVDAVDVARTVGEGDDLPTAAEFEVINGLRDRGYAVVVFTPQEVRGAKTSRIEDRLVEVGWDVIDVLGDPATPAGN